MIRRWDLLIASALCSVAWPQPGPGPAQFVTLAIAWENSVSYTDILADPAKLVTSPRMVSSLPGLRNFMPFIQIGDIVSLNGKPASGSWAATGRYVMIGRTPVRRLERRSSGADRYTPRDSPA